MVNVETSTFSKIFGQNARSIILEFFIEGRELDHAKQDVVDDTQLARSTIYKEWDALEKEGLIVQSRIVAKTKLYKLSTSNVVVQHLVRLYDTILRQNFMRVNEQDPTHKIRQLMRAASVVASAVNVSISSIRRDTSAAAATCHAAA